MHAIIWINARYVKTLIVPIIQNASGNFITNRPVSSRQLASASSLQNDNQRQQSERRQEEPLFGRSVGFALDVGDFPVKVDLLAFRGAAESEIVYQQLAVFLAGRDVIVQFDPNSSLPGPYYYWPGNPVIKLSGVSRCP